MNNNNNENKIPKPITIVREKFIRMSRIPVILVMRGSTLNLY